MSHCLGRQSWETPIGAVAESSLEVLETWLGWRPFVCDANPDGETHVGSFVHRFVSILCGSGCSKPFDAICIISTAASSSDCSGWSSDYGDSQRVFERIVLLPDALFPD